jgi:phage host-nuclease inhibitor protein Gam
MPAKKKTEAPAPELIQYENNESATSAVKRIGDLQRERSEIKSHYDEKIIGSSEKEKAFTGTHWMRIYR